MCKKYIALAVIGAGAFGVSLIFAPQNGYAQATDIGKQEYLNSCVSCHGEDGKGSGPVAGFLKQKVANLTVLAKDSGGVFPFARVYNVIDGREVVAAHGPRDMPVWGNKYGEQGDKAAGGYATSQELDSYARGKIIALIGYIYSLQAK